MTVIAQRQHNKVVTLPAPVRGLNTTGAVAQMPPTDAVQMDNFISTDLGVQLRSGWREFATHLGKEVRTVMSYEGSPAGATTAPVEQSQLFAVTDDGIYDVEGGGSMNGVSPMIALSRAPFAGLMSTVQFTTAAGQFLIACSEVDGAFIFNGLVWTKMTKSGGSGGSGGVGIIDNKDPALFVQVCAYKKRLMFVERNSTRAWIMADVGTVGGAVVLFDFGPLFRFGGMLLAMINWTGDAGDGIDDRLVVLSSSGDLVIYEGIDPTSINGFQNVGTWYIGAPPIGRRCFTTAGGNVFILTVFGVIPVANVIQGGLDTMDSAGSEYVQQLRKIQQLLNDDFDNMTHLLGWEIMHVPHKAWIHIARPVMIQGEYVQYVFQEHNLAWSRCLDIPAITFGRRLDELYAGTEDGRVLRVHDGSTDGMDLNGEGGQEVRGICTPAFGYFGDPALLKQALMLRVNFVANIDPGYVITMNTDFTLEIPSAAPAPGSSVGSLWGQSFWDKATWAGSAGSFGQWRSVEAMGYALTPSIWVASELPCTIASIEYMLKQGGPI